MTTQPPGRHGDSWTREEVLAAFYLRSQNLDSPADPRIIQLAKAVKRTPDAIWTQMLAFDQ